MVVQKLIDALGSDVVITEAGPISNYSFDWTGKYFSQPLAVIKPRNVDEVVTALSLCAQEKINVVTQGGNSGLVGGSVGDSRPHVILSTKDLRTPPTFDATSRQLTLGAGFTLQEVQEIAKSHGLVYPVDTASRGLATIGGTVATNAGGVRVLAFGMTEQQLIGIRMVLSDGTILDRLQRLKKENTGFDITKLALGSEGTLGVITDVCVQLVAERKVSWTALVPCESISAALDLSTPHQAQLLAAEIFQTRAANSIAQSEGMKTLPTDSAWWLLLEGDADKPDLPPGTLWAMTQSESAKLWNYRELQSSMLNRLSNVNKVDTSVRPDLLNEFITHITGKLNAGDNLFVFGHILDGNLHIAVVDGADDVTRIVLETAVALGGSISAEHGIGQSKNEFLPLVKSAKELEIMDQIRKSLDPAGVMNSHVLVTK